MTVLPDVRATDVVSLHDRAVEAAGVAAEWADRIDAEGRFPSESVAALRRLGLLAAVLPVDLGGEGATLTELADVATVLGGACASTAMVFAMHVGQVATLVRHGGTSVAAARLLARVRDEGALIASATTEITTGGDTGSSGCSVEATTCGVRLAKEAPVISYGLHASAVLATARRTPDSPPSDQVLVVCPAERTELVRRSGWDTLGLRGTASEGFSLTAEVDADHVLAQPFAEMSAQTMTPVSHVLWAAAWLGMARSATETARASVRRAARKALGTTPPAALRLAEVELRVQSLADTIEASARRWEAAANEPAVLESVATARWVNGLKVTASEAVLDIVSRALVITGIAGYRLGDPSSLGRIVRDAHGTALMVGNDRILHHNAKIATISNGRSNP
ncbi:MULTISPECIES: acyl-CoA dehydrogenase family protein [unclassified Curtobacterium]|uniref:acyl-CoA dehydrogenase family protein n=1 Tax=unclassified Curtobacterium TaxID=257496 RepID=UPI001C647D8B|nr:MULTISPECIES: acyl-CoA dehydrogenase family protein [unclassified Curtobacterium]WIE55886.1 acyl-CoA dehydrogenase family protein [Curtobacterium sp. MCBD17_003]